MNSAETSRETASPETMARSPLKWVGGKRQLLPELMKHVPEILRGDACYFEPFVGGGALFFSSALGCCSTTLSDTNNRLIRTYRGIRDDVAGVIALLKTYPYEAEFFGGHRCLLGH